MFSFFLLWASISIFTHSYKSEGITAFSIIKTNVSKPSRALWVEITAFNGKESF